MDVKILSFNSLMELSSKERLDKLLALVKKGDLVVFEGRLDSDEELTLTTKALQSVSGKFTGIEIAYLGAQNLSVVERIKHSLVKVLSGKSPGLTVVGPSKTIKEIKMDPNNLEILLK
jgi:hypothetical protein